MASSSSQSLSSLRYTSSSMSSSSSISSSTAEMTTSSISSLGISSSSTIGLSTSSESSPSSLSSISSLSSASSLSSSSLSTSSAFGFITEPFNITLSPHPKEQKISISWEWENILGNEPLVPTGFIIERKIGSESYSTLTYQIDGTDRSYADVLSVANAGRIFVDRETVYYRIKAYWISS